MAFLLMFHAMGCTLTLGEDRKEHHSEAERGVYGLRNGYCILFETDAGFLRGSPFISRPSARLFACLFESYPVLQFPATPVSRL